MTALRRVLFPLLAMCAVLTLVASACTDDDGSVTPADDAEQTSDGDGSETSEAPETDPSPLVFEDLISAMDMPVTAGVAQMASITVDGETALVTAQYLRPSSSLIEVSVNPELVGLDMATHGDLVARYQDDEGLLHSGTFSDAQRTGLSGFLLAMQGFPVTFDDFSLLRYLEDDTSGEQIQPIPATYGEAWEDDGMAPNEIPGEFIVLTFDGMEELDGVPTRRYELTVDQDAADAAEETFDEEGYPVTIWVDESDVLRQVRSSPISSDLGELQMQLSVFDLDDSPVELPDDARAFSIQELTAIASPPATLPDEQQQLLDFSTALESAIDEFTENSPFEE